jgi:hypothetical protein
MNFSEQLRVCMKSPRNFTRIDYSDPANLLPMRRAMVMKCLDCCGGDRALARECGVKTCALFPYRAGLNPRPKRTLTPERLEKARSRMKRLARERRGGDETISEGPSTTPPVSGASNA